MGVFNRRNAVTGWVTVKVGKWFLRRKAKRVQLNPLGRRRAARQAKAASKGGKGSKR